ncbi:hypothetical protein ACJ72_00376 [Emergomyces africanus]|uniref:Uncharacterized protein n=1 Tax=Emergomyces africanus TaxID=1955775 RepID=A0A1B7P898_9EURO|nr:hypothetical protein ACJ72_00376 [Emergomyces africanus]
MSSTCLAFYLQKTHLDRTTYIFHKQDNNLTLCPVSHFLALALADDAFDARGINSVEDVLRIQVMTPRNSLHLKWKPHMLNIPVFSRAIHTTERIRISPDKALPYDTFNQYLQHLEHNAEFEHMLTPYCNRRGTANAVDTVATTSERNQVMDHSRADIFKRYYISVKVKRDVQSTYLGYPARESIIETVERFSLTRNPRAPKKLSNEHKKTIERDPQLVKLCDQQRSLRKLIKRKHGSVPKSKDTALHHEYTELENTIRAEKQTLHHKMFENMRQKFFATIDTIKIERQLLELSINKKLKMNNNDKVQFVFENLREGPHKQRVSSADSEVNITFNSIIDTDTFPISCPGTQCLFCLGDSQLPHSARIYSFSRPDHLRRHVQNCHLRYLDPDALLWCPHPSCPDALDGVEDFQGPIKDVSPMASRSLRASVEVASGLALSDEALDVQCRAAAQNRPFDLVANNCQKFCSQILQRLVNNGAITQGQFDALAVKGFQPLI